MLVTIEGIDGTGKTTLVKKMLEVFPFAVGTREPQDKEFIAEQSLSSMGELYAYMLDHSHHNEYLKLANEKDLIFCDRYVDSRIAYQSVKLELPIEFIRDLHYDSVEPDVTFILNADISFIAKRLEKRDGEMFFTDLTDVNDTQLKRKRELYLYELSRVQDKYIELAQDVRGGYVIIDITKKSVEDIAYEIELYLWKHFKSEVEMCAKKCGYPNPLYKGMRIIPYR